MNSVTTIFPMVFLLDCGAVSPCLLPQRRTEGGEIDMAGPLTPCATTKAQKSADALAHRARMGAPAQLRAGPRRRLHVDVRGRADGRNEVAGLQALLDPGIHAPRHRR